MRKNKKNTKIQSVFLAAIEKYKKNTKVQGVFFSYFCLYLFCIFLYFYKKNTKKIRKKYESKISKIQNTKKIQTQNLENTKYKKNTKKIRIQNLKNTKYEKKRQIPCSLSEEKPKLQKKCKNNMLYFLHPAVLILYFQVVLFLYFFCIFNSFQHSLL